jgi:hypothetical protein
MLIAAEKLLMSSSLSTFPQASNHKMPAYMNNILAAVNGNTLRSSFCSENLLDYIGNMAQRHCYNHLLNLFDSEEPFIKYCVEVVSCRYIAKALQVLEHDKRGILSREEYQHILNQCKVVSDEIYLGKCSFSIELV